MHETQDTLNLSGIVEDSIVDGPGIRVTVFCQGCPHGCPGCHNPQSHAFGIGTDLSAQEIYNIVGKSPLCKGVTFSGGEPFSQPEGFAALARLLRAGGYEVACYTGYTFEQLQSGTPAQRALLGLVDVLVDGLFLLAQRNLDLRFRGSENQRILDVQRSLAQGVATWYSGARWVGEA